MVRGKGQEMLNQVVVFQNAGWRFHLWIALLNVIDGLFVGLLMYFFAARAAHVVVPMGMLIWLCAIVFVLSKIPISVANLGVREVTLIGSAGSVRGRQIRGLSHVDGPVLGSCLHGVAGRGVSTVLELGETMKACPVCKGPGREYRRIGDQWLAKCTRCGFVYAGATDEEVDRVNSQYGESTERHYDEIQTGLDYLWFDRISARLTRGRTGLKVLDIGCGNGVLLRQFQKRGCQCFGSDPSPWARTCAERYGYTLLPRIEDADVEPGFFDVITSTSTLEHIARPLEHVQRILELLKPGGTAYFTIPNYGSLPIRLHIVQGRLVGPPSHCNYFTTGTLQGSFPPEGPGRARREDPGPQLRNPRDSRRVSMALQAKDQNDASRRAGRRHLRSSGPRRFWRVSITGPERPSAWGTSWKPRSTNACSDQMDHRKGNQMNKTVRSILRTCHLYDAVVDFKHWLTGVETQYAEFYSQFVKPGDLCFDVGATSAVGRRCSCGFRRESSPWSPRNNAWRNCVASSEATTAWSSCRAPWARSPGQMQMQLCDSHSLSSLSPQWIEKVRASGRYCSVHLEQDGDDRCDDPGRADFPDTAGPAFIKLDVEGYEYEALKGLSQPVPSVCFEFTPEFVESTRNCVDHLSRIGQARFNYCLEGARDLLRAGPVGLAV